MSSVNRRVSTLAIVAAIATGVAGCHVSNNPLPVASGGEPAGMSMPNSGINGTIYRANPVGYDEVAVQNGRRLFVWYNCADCHGTHGGGDIGPSLRDFTWRYGNSNQDIFNSIAQGRPNGMPTWGKKIPEGQIWELVAYIKSMGTSREADPPLEPAAEAVGNPMQKTSTAPGTPVSNRRR
jgi:mono/diheme cytochrome c family protein